MARSKSKPINFGFNVMTPEAIIREAKYLVKWNIPLALEWMSSVENKAIISGSIMLKQYNNTVKAINAYLDCIEKQRYYDKKEFWGSLQPTRLKEIEESKGVPVDLDAHLQKILGTI